MCCLGGVQDTIPQISSLPHFSDHNYNFTGLLGQGLHASVKYEADQ